MNLLFICKASTETGFGHLIRSRTLALKTLQVRSNDNIKFITIGKSTLFRLLDGYPLDYTIINDEDELNEIEDFDIVFLDLLDLKNTTMKHLKEVSKTVVSLSPIFNQLGQVNLLFNRTKYFELDKLDPPEKIMTGMEFSLIQEDCKKISAGVYEDNLNASSFPIAISMGGGDAANKTLRFLKSLRKCTVPATFWVMLGEGYHHSYDKLIEEIRSDSNHEIILAKTNKSMWQILKNCILVILPGGVTTYEAAYAGLPSINLFEFENQQFLVKELVENDACMNLGLISDQSLIKLNLTIEELYNDRNKLLRMHIHSKSLLDSNGGNRIISESIKHFEES